MYKEWLDSPIWALADRLCHLAAKSTSVDTEMESQKKTVKTTVVSSGSLAHCCVTMVLSTYVNRWPCVIWAVALMPDTQFYIYTHRSRLHPHFPLKPPRCMGTAYCVLRTLNIFVCCCCVGSDRAAGVRGMQALDLMRDDGRLCLR